MLHKLEKRDYAMVRPLFAEPEESQLMCMAVLGDKGKAMEYLNKMADGGSKNVQAYTENELLRSLQGLPEWEAFLVRIRENQKTNQRLGERIGSPNR